MKLVRVKYVGKKPYAFDNITKSGKCWAGHGDVQEVTEAQAKALIAYADQWALVNAEDAAGVAANGSVIQVQDEKSGEVTEVDASAMKKPLENMTKPELAAYAMQRWGKKLDMRKSSKDLIDQIEEFEQDVDVKRATP